MNTDLAQVGKVDGDTVINAGTFRKRGVSATFDGERAVCVFERRENGRDVFGGVRRDEAIGSKFGLATGPVVVGSSVRCGVRVCDLRFLREKV